MIKYNPLYRNDGTLNGALLTPPSESIVFDVPGQCIWVKGVKLKGTDTTYTFSHDNYITLTNTPGNPEDIKIGVNITTLKAVIDTTYDIVSSTADGLAPQYASNNIADTDTTTDSFLLGWLGSALKWFKLPYRAIKIAGTEVLSSFTKTALNIIAGTGISVDWDSSNNRIVITNTSPDINHNTDFLVGQYVTSSNYDYRLLFKRSVNDTEETSTVRFATNLTFNPSTKALKIDGVRVVTLANIYVGATASANAQTGLVPEAASAQRNYFLRGDGTWQQIAAQDTWRPIQINGTEYLGSGTDTDALNIVAGTGIGVAWDATNKKIIISNTAPDVPDNTDRTAVYKGTVSGTEITNSTLIVNNSAAGLIFEGGTNLFKIGDGTNYIKIPITPLITVTDKSASILATLTTIATIEGTDIKAKVVVDNKAATIGTTATTIATIAGVDITAKIGSYLPSTHVYPLSIAADTGTSSITLLPSSKYKLTAGGSTYVFTSTPDEKVRQVPKTDNVNRPLMMINGGTSSGELTSTSMFSTGIYANASTKMITANGFIKSGFDDTSVLLAGGGAKALTDFAMSDAYVKKSGDTMTGNLIVPRISIGNSSTSNFIEFHGLTGDSGTGNTWDYHFMIGNRIWNSETEASELVLVCENDIGNGNSAITGSSSGPDRIRHIAAAHLFQTYTVATSGTLETIATSPNLKNIFEINTNSIHSWVPATFDGRVVIGLDNDADASSNTSGSLMIGSASGLHLLFDANEIVSANNTSVSTLYLQYNGGTLLVGGAGTCNSTFYGQIYINGAYPHIDMTSTSAESSIYFRPNSGTSWAIGKAPWGVGGFGIGIIGDGNKLAILDNGNVGIGTMSPSHKLDVYGSSMIIGNGTSEAHIYARTSNFSNPALSFYDDTSGYGTMAVLGGGGCTVVGGGESAHEFAPNVRDENLYLTADANVNIFTNLDGGYSSRRHVAQFTTGGDTYLYGNLYLGANASNNFIAFYGNTGDDPGYYQTSFIGEHLWGSPESTELLLMKFNDTGSGTSGTSVSNSGPDRIRHLAHAHVFQIMTSTAQGSFTTMANSTACETKLEICRNCINSFTSIILKGSTTADMSYSGNVHPYIRFDNSDSSQNVSFIFTDWDDYREPAGIKLVGNLGNEWFESPRIYSSFHHLSHDNNDSVLLAGGSYKAISDFSLSSHNHDGRYARTHWGFASGSDNANVTCTSLDTWVSRLSAVGGVSNYGSISSGAWWWVRSTDFQVNNWNIRSSGAMIIYCGDGSFSSKNYKHFLVLDAYADLYGITSNEESWKYYTKFLNSRNYTDFVNNYYWANVKISTTSLTNTTPTVGYITASTALAATSTMHPGSGVMTAGTSRLYSNGLFITNPGTPNDGGFIRCTGSDENNTVLEIGTWDDGGTTGANCEQIACTQYASGMTLWLLDSNHNTRIPGNLGVGLSPSYKLDVSGDVCFGSGGSEAHLYGRLANNTNAFLSIYNDPSGYGLRTCLGGGGCTVVGAGESAHSFAPNYNDENLYLIADTNVEIYTNVDTYSSRRNVASFRTDYTSHFMGDTYCHGNLYVGGNASNNFIAFYGNTGDAPGSYVTTFIGEHLWGGSESTELLLMKFNDTGNGTDAITASGAGPDRIRYLSHAHVFLIMTDTSQGDFATMAGSSSVETKFLIARNLMSMHVPLSIVNDSSNSGYDGLLYLRHYSNNDWGLIVDKSQSYTYGVDIRAAGAYALKVGNGNTRLIGATIIGADATPEYTLDVRGTGRFTGRVLATSGASSWLDGLRYNNALINMTNTTDASSYWPIVRWLSSSNSRWASIGVLGNNLYFMSSSTSRTSNGYDTAAYLDYTSSCWYAAHYYEHSDARLKHDIIPISQSIRKFYFNNDDRLYYGFIAQELETLHPELVDNSGEYKTVNYNSAICYYIAELENKVQKLEEKIKILENKYLN